MTTNPRHWFDRMIATVIGVLVLSLVALMVFGATGCQSAPKSVEQFSPEDPDVQVIYNSKFVIIRKLDYKGCQYLFSTEYMVHAGNCSNRIHRTPCDTLR